MDDSSIHRFSFSRRAFSLVELAIVLVILGLLTGGILTGQSLIHASELRSLGADYQRYTVAVNAFRDKYFSLPGDITNATGFWGFASGSTGIDSACYNTDSTGQRATCNGDGNGRLFYYDGGTSDGHEWYRAWQHLANAGLVEGTFSGKFYTSPRSTLGGVNAPTTRVGSYGAVTLMSISVPVAATAFFPGNYDGFMFGRATPTGLYEAGAPFITAEDAWNIDTKLDDGRPGTGFIRPRTSYGCASPDDGSNAVTAVYALNNTGQRCAMFLAISNPGGN